SGALTTTLTEQAAGAGVERIFDVQTGVTATISDLAIVDVFQPRPEPNPPCGAGILNRGILTARRVQISRNLFRRSGGGVCNYGGQLTISDSTINDNLAAFAGSGGGIDNWGGIASISNTLISG